MASLINCVLNWHRVPKEKWSVDNFGVENGRNVHKFHRTIPNYRATPLVELENLARELKVARFYCKNESHRFGLNAFKFLGVSYAIAKLLAKKLDQNKDLTWQLVEESLEMLEEKPIFVTATDGNHGHAVAYAANILGCRAIVYMPKDTTELRIKRTKQLDADVRVTNVGYDETVLVARELSRQLENSIFIQDTTLPDYEEIPLDIMQGYQTILAECWQQGGFSDSQKWPTHIFLQVGVGSFSGALAGYLADQLISQQADIKVICVEPRGADCVYQSAQRCDGRPEILDGDLETIMAGLNCGTPSDLGWPILRDVAHAFLSCTDDVTKEGMRTLYHPLKGDNRIISGESGAVTTGAVQLICGGKFEKLRNALQIDCNSKILVVSTEGDTDAENFVKIVTNP